MDFFSSFCSLRNVFLIQESDREGNQSYSNFLEVCKLAGVLTTINKPTTGLLSLPNMDNYTATRASGPPASSSTLTFFAPFYSTSETAVSVKVNLRPYLRELFLATDPLYISLSPSIRLLFAQPLTTMGCPSALQAQSANRNVPIQLLKDPTTCNNRILTEDHC